MDYYKVRNPLGARRLAMSRTMRWFALMCGLLLMAAPMFAATQNAVVYGTV